MKYLMSALLSLAHFQEPRLVKQYFVDVHFPRVFRCWVKHKNEKPQWPVFQNPLFSMLVCGHALLRLLIWMHGQDRPDPPVTLNYRRTICTVKQMSSSESSMGSGFGILEIFVLSILYLCWCWFLQAPMLLPQLTFCLPLDDKPSLFWHSWNV